MVLSLFYRRTLILVGLVLRGKVTAIRSMTDAQLDTAVPISLYGDAPLTLQFWLEDHQVTHSYRHLAIVKAAIG
ncbi:hypothetical protein BH10CHL1_BH10CHL1_44960 [soil metagenome]